MSARVPRSGVYPSKLLTRCLPAALAITASLLCATSVLARPVARQVAPLMTPPATTRQAAGKATNLEALTVTGRRFRQPVYRVFETNTATGTDTPLLDIPQSIQTVPDTLLRDQAAVSLASAMRNVPGVYAQQGEGNRDEFYIRGVKTKSDFFVDGLRDDTEYFRDFYNVAHIDVLQGPAAVLFGRGGAGGIINLVTKKPQWRPIRSVSLETGSWRHLRATLDVGNAIDHALAYRFMAMAEDSSSFREHFFLHRYAVNPEVLYQIDARTELSFGASWLKDYRFADRGIPSRNGRPADVPRDRFFGSVVENRAQSRVATFNARIQHRIGAHLKFRNAFRVSDTKRYYRNAYPGSPVNDDGELELKAYDHPSNRLSYIDRAELIAAFDTGALHHKLLGGAEYSWQRGNDVEFKPGSSKTLPGLFPVARPIVGKIDFSYLDRNNHVVGKELGLYAEDRLSWGKHWIALAGIRWDRFSVNAHYKKPGVTPDHTFNVTTTWSPRIGLIYKPVQNDSLYANVTRTYTPQGANIALSQKSPNDAHLAPQKATNYEIGNKLNFFEDRLAITVALFQLNLKDQIAKAADGSGDLVNTGAQRNRGVELSVVGDLTSRWKIYANYTWLDARITATTKDARVGARAGLVPRNQFSLWSVYVLTPHWGVGGGIRGASRKFTSYDNGVVLPGYATLGAMAYYQTGDFRVQLNLENLADKKYYPTANGDNQIMPGAPFGVFASLRVKF
jgi:catecholate siderophore receptor